MTPEQFQGKSFDYLHGYHAAMQAIAEKSLEITTRLQTEHAQTKATFFGNPTHLHHQLIGGGRVSKEIGDFAFQAGNVAFAYRKGAK